ncbi:MAG: recombinase family protein [Candidatus Moduliflexus flocculans]|nr:recombinase family protein [Candidatus Moduliflexus flocculans]
MTETRPGQISAGHLQRLAIVYLRQSSPRQVEENTGSTDFQRDQADYARQWGWPENAIEIIDEDLGLSGTSVKARTGWQRVLRLGDERDGGHHFRQRRPQRLNRSSHDFHLLAELCRQMGVLLVVDGRIVDFNDPTDSFMATIRAAVAQYDNALRTKTCQTAARAKARRGHAVRQPPTGYEEADKGQWVKDRDQAVRDAIERTFQDYLRLGSLGKLLRVYHEHNLLLPIRARGTLRWAEPYRVQLHRILTNPAYRGDYVFGRRVTVRGKTTRQGNPEQIIVVPGHHEPYVTPEVWAQVQAQLAHNRLTVRQPAGKGSALCQGLLRCGRCGLNDVRAVLSPAGWGRAQLSLHPGAATLRAAAVHGRSTAGRWTRSSPRNCSKASDPDLEAVIGAAQERERRLRGGRPPAPSRGGAGSIRGRSRVAPITECRSRKPADGERPRARSRTETGGSQRPSNAGTPNPSPFLRSSRPRKSSPPSTLGRETSRRCGRRPPPPIRTGRRSSGTSSGRSALAACTDITFDIEIHWVGGATSRHTIPHPTAFSRLTEHLQVQGRTEEEILEEVRRRGLRTSRQGRLYDLNDVRAALRRRARKGQRRTRPPWKPYCESLRPLMSEAGREWSVRSRGRGGSQPSAHRRVLPRKALG